MSKQQETKKQSGDSHSVVSEFRDKSDWNTLYEVGQDVSFLDKDRLDELVEKGLVKSND